MWLGRPGRESHRATAAGRPGSLSDNRHGRLYVRPARGRPVIRTPRGAFRALRDAPASCPGRARPPRTRASRRRPPGPRAGPQSFPRGLRRTCLRLRQFRVRRRLLSQREGLRSLSLVPALRLPARAPTFARVSGARASLSLSSQLSRSLPAERLSPLTTVSLRSLLAAASRDRACARTRRARAVPTSMILTQVHLRKPCYDFYFLEVIKFVSLSASRRDARRRRVPRAVREPH